MKSQVHQVLAEIFVSLINLIDLSAIIDMIGKITSTDTSDIFFYVGREIINYTCPVN